MHPLQGKIVKLGKVMGIELNHKSRPEVKKGDPSVAVRIESPVYDTPKLFGRHFFEKDEIYSHVGAIFGLHWRTFLTEFFVSPDHPRFGRRPENRVPSGS